MWRASFLTFIALLSPAAIAAVELLPGSSPQRAELGSDFAPIRVRVTDGRGAPVAGAIVRERVVNWFSPGLWPVAFAGCTRDFSIQCSARTDAEGVVELRAFYGLQVGEHEVVVDARSDDFGSYGEGRAVFTVEPYSTPSPALAVLSGGSQTVPRGIPFKPFVVQALDGAGRPVPNVAVEFSNDSGYFGVFGSSDFQFGQYSTRVTTDANGIATPAAFTGGPGIGEGAVRASFTLPGTRRTASARFGLTVSTFDGRTSLRFQDMWWSGPSESGWGVSVAQRNDRIFAVMYAYDDTGRATWRVLPDTGGNGRYVVYGGNGYSPRGSPYFEYDASRFVPGRHDSYMHFTFHDEGAARFQIDTAAGRAIKSLERQDYTSDEPAPLTGLADMWWGGPEQNGWGIALMEQAGGLFSVWLTYDEQGLPTWFAMPSGRWTDSSTFEGEIFQTSGPRWPDYDKSRLVVAPVGRFAYRFHDREHATFSWTIAERSGSNAITRQPF